MCRPLNAHRRALRHFAFGPMCRPLDAYRQAQRCSALVLPGELFDLCLPMENDAYIRASSHFFREPRDLSVLLVNAQIWAQRSTEGPVTYLLF